MSIPIVLESESSGQVGTTALIDSGAEGLFINKVFACYMGIELKTLMKPIKVFNVDGTWNKTGYITEYCDVDLKIHCRTRSQRLLATGLGQQKVIVGLPWLRDENPDIDWRKGTLRWRNKPETSLHGLISTSFYRSEDRWNPEDDTLTCSYIQGKEIENPVNPDKIWINLKISESQKLAQKAAEGKVERTTEELVPEAFHEYLKVFSEEESNRFPKSKPWNHKIILKDNFTPNPGHIFKTTPKEDKMLRQWLDEHLAKGFI